MDVLIRPIKDDERKEVVKVGRRAFKGFESIFVPKPKDAFIAEVDGKIAGALLYKIQDVSDYKIGYMDFGFVDPKYHGKGIGGMLYKKSIDHMFETCDYISGIVKDDNVGSWGLLKKQGFKRIGIFELVKTIGLSGFIKQSIGTALPYGVGMEYYLASKKPLKEKSGSFNQVLSYLILNMILLLISAISFSGDKITNLLSFLSVFVGLIASGFIGSRLSKHKWRFRVMDCGFGIHFLVHLTGGIFPFIGNWYPESYDKSKSFDRALGLVGLMKWLFLILVASMGLVISSENHFLYMTSQLATFMMIYYPIAIYPFESYGGGRVFRWNKLVYGIMTILTILVLVY